MINLVISCMPSNMPLFAFGMRRALDKKKTAQILRV